MADEKCQVVLLQMHNENNDWIWCDRKRFIDFSIKSKYVKIPAIGVCIWQETTRNTE